MIRANLAEASKDLIDLAAQVERGEDVVLEREGMPVIRLVAVRPQPPLRTSTSPRPSFLGALEGQFSSVTDEDWAEMDREIEETFNESVDLPFDAEPK